MRSDGPLKRIAIIGSHAELWLASAFLASTLQKFGIGITTIELPSSSRSKLVTLSPKSLNAIDLMRVKEVDLVRSCRAGYSLGLDCKNACINFFIPYGDLGLSGKDRLLISYSYKHVFQLEMKNLNALCLSGYSALHNKFAIAGDDRPDLKKLLRYGLTLDADSLSGFMRNYCNRLGVKIEKYEGAPEEIKFNKKSVFLEGKVIDADFWIDLTEDGLLNGKNELSKKTIEENLFVAQSWEEAAPSKAVIDIRTAGEVMIKSCTSSDVKQTAIYSKYKNILVKECSKEKYRNLVWSIKEKRNSIPSSIWSDNCLRLGDSSLNFSDILLSRLDFILAALVYFVDYLPGKNVNSKVALLYNENILNYFSEIKDFTDIIFLLADKQHSLSDASVRRKRLFLRSGKLIPNLTDAVDICQWQTLLYGVFGEPEISDIRLDRLGNDQVQKEIDLIKTNIRKISGGMPEYSQFLRRILNR